MCQHGHLPATCNLPAWSSSQSQFASIHAILFKSVCMSLCSQFPACTKKKTCMVGTMSNHINLKVPKIPLTLMMPGCMQYPPCLSATRATITVAALSRTDWSILLSISSWTRPCISQMWLDRKSDCRQSTIAWVDHGNRCISMLKAKPLPCNKKKRMVS